MHQESLASVATWADVVKNQHTAPWHFLDIPKDQTAYDPQRDCKGDNCIIAQIERFRGILGDTTRREAERIVVLKYLVHFLGDLHQPPHCADNMDRGGNEVLVTFLGQETNPHTQKLWYLHAVWDQGIIEEKDTSDIHYAKRLNAWLNHQDVPEMTKGTVIEWAIEAHKAARHDAFHIPNDRQLGEPYYETNLPVVDRQLAKSRARLAHILKLTLEGN